MRRSGDYDNDGFDDLAIGLTGEDVGAAADAGALHVLYGGAGAGLVSAGDLVWTQDTAGIEAAEGNDRFAATLAAGDFDGDGFADLAVAAIDEDVGALVDSGLVHAFYGGAGGLSTAGSQVWTPDSPGVEGVAESNESFGDALAVGDFNGDGFDDLAIGLPFESVGALLAAGSVHVLPGSATGLTAAGDQLWTQDSGGIAGSAAQPDQFGAALVAADFNGDGFDDLAIGVPGEDVGGVDGAGGVNLLYGSAGGLSNVGDQLWTQGTAGVANDPETGDQFGAALAAGDFNGDGFADLAVGVPIEDLGAVADAGGVHVLFGAAGGLGAAGDQFWTQDTAGIAGTAEAGDEFGAVLAVGDFNGDGFDDLAVGVPEEGLGVLSAAGAVHVIFGSASGLTNANDQIWTQDIAGVLGQAETGDRFGSALIVGDYDGDGFDDLAIGVPGEDLDDINGAGGAVVLYGSAAGLTAIGDQFWSQDSPGVNGGAEAGDGFGRVLG